MNYGKEKLSAAIGSEVGNTLMIKIRRYISYYRDEAQKMMSIKPENFTIQRPQIDNIKPAN